MRNAPKVEYWKCWAQRDHGLCNTVNGLDEATCGACGADKPEKQDIIERMFGPRPASAEVAKVVGLDLIGFDNQDTTKHTGFVLRYSIQGIGFGELAFFKDVETGKFHCENEAMSKAWVTRILKELIDRSEFADT